MDGHLDPDDRQDSGDHPESTLNAQSVSAMSPLSM